MIISNIFNTISLAVILVMLLLFNNRITTLEKGIDAAIARTVME